MMGGNGQGWRGMMFGMNVFWLLSIVVFVLGTVALAKYLPRVNGRLMVRGERYQTA